MNESVPLESVANVVTGTAVNRRGTGSRAVMVGDLNGSGELPTGLSEVGPPAGGRAASLGCDDLVVSLRGNHNLAATVKQSDLHKGSLFATLDLAVLRLRRREAIEPEYLCVYLNLPSTQQMLGVHRSGSAALRLPLDPLRKLLIPMPSLERQRAIVELARCATDEQRLSQRLVHLRTDLMNKLIRQSAEEAA